MRKNDRVVPKKNYLYLLLMILGVVILTFLVFNITGKMEEKRINESYLGEFVNKITINEVDNLLIEPDSDLFIFVTKTGDKDIYKLEKELKKIIKNNNIRDNFVLIDSTNIDITNLEKYNVNSSNVPAIIYFKNGEFVKTIDSNKNLLKSTDLEQLLEEYELLND